LIRQKTTLNIKLKKEEKSGIDSAIDKMLVVKFRLDQRAHVG